MRVTFLLPRLIYGMKETSTVLQTK